MTIERISSPMGFPLKPKESVAEGLSRFIREPGLTFETLSEGHYDVTPGWFHTSNYIYELIVQEEGTGVLRLKPRYPDSATYDYENGRTSALATGGRTIHLPHDESMFVTVGSTKDKKALGIAQVIYWHPGGNPKQNP